MNFSGEDVLSEIVSPHSVILCKYLQYHFDGERKLKLTKNEVKKERREKKKRNPSIWARVQQSSLECREMPFSGRLAKCLQPVVLQLNIEGTTTSKMAW